MLAAAVAGAEEPAVVAGADPVAAATDPEPAADIAGFAGFARAKLQEMNENHLLSRSRMQVTRAANGLYRGLFHELDGSSLSYRVQPSTSDAAQYVAVMSYQEQVYAASCATPEACLQGPFETIAVIPNRHIFIYRDGSWQ